MKNRQSIYHNLLHPPVLFSWPNRRSIELYNWRFWSCIEVYECWGAKEKT